MSNPVLGVPQQNGLNLLPLLRILNTLNCALRHTGKLQRCTDMVLRVAMQHIQSL
jgi:hypothetical protein